jgi:hypothetical protein
VQCDVCKVWQHGGCVGIMTEESSPDEYFCEQCRQDLHKLWTASNGYVLSPIRPHGNAPCRGRTLRHRRSCLMQLPLRLNLQRTLKLVDHANNMARRSVYSHYLPLKRYARSTSRAASLNKDTARSPTKEKETRSGRNSSASQASKRRSTLNSREAGYDEAEALRRAIEASKEELGTEPGETVSRRPKRGRSDSQEYVSRARYLCGSGGVC